MATVISAVTAVFGAYFAGVTAVANIASAYQDYRKNHPRRNQTGPRSDYVQLHCGYNIKLLQQQNPFYLGYAHLLPKSAHDRRGFRDSLKDSLKRLWNRTKSMSSTSGRQPEHDLEGKVVLCKDVQKAPDTHRDEYVGLNTGRQPRYQMSDAEKHWATIRNGSALHTTAAPTIAVVNWTTEEITMFILNEQLGPKGMFFRNYRVCKCNLINFADDYRNQMVFSGIIKDGRLVGTSSTIYLAEDDRTCKLQSTNSWQLLGVGRETALPKDEFMFLEMDRAVLFGLVECIYEDPTLVNVDIRAGANGSVEFVHVDTPDTVKLSYKGDNFFSVFAFNDNEYSQRRVLVG